MNKNNTQKTVEIDLQFCEDLPDTSLTFYASKPTEKSAPCYWLSKCPSQGPDSPPILCRDCPALTCYDKLDLAEAISWWKDQKIPVSAFEKATTDAYLDTRKFKRYDRSLQPNKRADTKYSLT